MLETDAQNIIDFARQISEYGVELDRPLRGELQEELAEMQKLLPESGNGLIFLRTCGRDDEQVRREWSYFINAPLRGHDEDFRMNDDAKPRMRLCVPSQGESKIGVGIACANDNMSTGHVSSMLDDKWTPIVQCASYRAMCVAQPLVFSSAFPNDIDVIVCISTSDPYGAELAASMISMGCCLLCDEGGKVHEALLSCEKDSLWNPLIQPGSITMTWGTEKRNGYHVMQYRWALPLPEGVRKDLIAYDTKQLLKTRFDELKKLCNSSGEYSTMQTLLNALSYGGIKWGNEFEDLMGTTNKQDTLPIDRYNYLLESVPDEDDDQLVRIQQAIDVIVIWKTILNRMALAPNLPCYDEYRLQELADAGDALGVKVAVEAYLGGISRDYILS